VRSVVSLRTAATIVCMKAYSSGLAADLSADGDLGTVVRSFPIAIRHRTIPLAPLRNYDGLGSDNQGTGSPMIGRAISVGLQARADHADAPAWLDKF
jgi:hypothetical protein